jgi:anti-sigma regulatory factor (Ser/Thr protein kinase)
VAPLLTEEWTDGLDAIPIADEASVSLAREAARKACAAAGLDEVAAGAVALIVSELAHNQLAHARHGVVAVTTLERGATRGVEIIAADRGHGLRDPEAALRGTAPKNGSLGVGLAGARRMADEMDFDVRLEEGTCIRARKFAGRVARRREVALFGRPIDGERVSGDQAAFVRTDGALVLAVVDGLGHGADAREASSRAVAVVREQPNRPPDEILRACDARLTQSRGAVMNALRIDEAAGTLAHASVGNVVTRIVARGSSQGITGSAAVLGQPSAQPKRILTSHLALTPLDTIVIFTDGLSSKLDLAEQRDLLAEPPIVIAQRLMNAFGKTSDDALVLVAR